MNRYRCCDCGGICDPGELENGVCFDCRKGDLDYKKVCNPDLSKSVDYAIEDKNRNA